MRVSAEIQALVAVGLVVYGTVALYAAIWRPKLLDNPLVRPRWWGFGPKASRPASGFAAGAWIVLGFFGQGHAFGILPSGSNGWVLLLIVLLLAGAVIAQLASGRGDAV